MNDENRPEKVNCVYCGAEVKVGSKGPISYACGKCMRRKTSRYALRVRQALRGTVRPSEIKDLVEKDMVEYGKNVKDNPEAAAHKAPERKPMPDKSKRCRFCGGIWQVRGGYCHTCRTEGLDKVHAITGRSNGWDRKVEKPESVQVGWRGQNKPGCGGAGMSIYRYMAQKAYDTP